MTELKAITIIEQAQDDIFSNRCSQIKCSYYLMGGCKSCNSCQAKPYYINHSCENCVKCMTVPNCVRFDMSKAEIKAEQEETIKEFKKILSEMKK